MCFDLLTEKKVWEVSYPKEQGGFDRTCVTPDGKKVYVPEGWWSNVTTTMKVLDGETGKTIKEIPLGAFTSPTQALGRVLAVRVVEGQPLTESSLVANRLFKRPTEERTLT